MDKQETITQICARLRREVAEMCIERGGHIASSFSCMEILVTLYHAGVLRISPNEPDAPGRDRFILSKGHGETVLYAVLADRDFFSRQLIKESYRHGECRLGGHPSHHITGIEVSTGSLGHGLGLACGLAMAAKLDKASHHHFVLLGDAECTEGSVWEACLFAAARGLGNLTAIVDRNNIGSIDFTDKFTSLEPFADKWKAFGWDVLECDGHNPEALRRHLLQFRDRKSNRPSVVIAKTVKGKGVSFIENSPLWHVKQLADPTEIAQARRELAGEENA